MSTSVLRRYTPPTCTLEVAAIGSALSRWTDRAVLKNLRFELSFDDPTTLAEHPVTVKGDRQQLEELWDVVSGYVHRGLLIAPGGETLLQGDDGVDHSVDNGVDSGLNASGMRLQPKGLLAHELHLGSLANEASGAVIPLTTLQLFDLANALDEYQAEALTLPSLGRPRWLQSVPSGWMPIAAAAAAAAVVAAIPMVQFVANVSRPTATQQAANPANTRDVEISRAPKAGDLPAPRSPGATPPALTLTPISPGAGTLTVPAPVPGAIVPNAPSAPSLPVLPVDPAPAPAAPVVPSDPTTIEIPGESGDFAQAPNRPRMVVPEPEAPPPRLERPEFDDGLGNSGATTSRSAAPAAAPSTADSAARQSVNDELAAAGLGTPDAATAESSAATAEPGAAAAGATNNQAAEVKSYFEQNWQPPEGLTESLEYRLLLRPDGSLQRILPLGNTAETFLDRTNMPLINEPFVSPTINGRSPQIRVVLQPDGGVKTFLEYAD
jgi:hypothetical protein